MSQTLFDDAFLKKLEYLNLVSKKIFNARVRPRRKKIVGSGIEFADYRDYVAGDDLRYLDWSILARTERMLIRLFEEEEDLYLYILLDHSQSMLVGGPEKLEYAKKVAAALAYIALSNMNRVSVIPFAERLIERLPPSRGHGQIFKVLRFLERDFGAGRPTDLKTSLRTFVTQNKRRGVAVVISDFYDLEGQKEGLDALRYNKFEPIVCQLYDQQDLTPNLLGDLDLVDCESNRVVRITLTRDMLERYRVLHREMQAELEGFCRSKNLLYFAAPIGVPFDELILRILRSGGVS